jgi:hypothetical protein
MHGNGSEWCDDEAPPDKRVAGGSNGGSWTTVEASGRVRGPLPSHHTEVWRMASAWPAFPSAIRRLQELAGMGSPSSQGQVLARRRRWQAGLKKEVEFKEDYLGVTK